MTPEQLAEKFSSTPPEAFVGGDIGCKFFRLTYQDREAVLKIGHDEDSRAEIAANYQGYTSMAALFILDVVGPEIFLMSREPRALHYILMEDLGPDFRSSVSEENEARFMGAMTASFMVAYDRTKQEDMAVSVAWLEGIKADQHRYFSNYLVGDGVLTPEEADEVLALDVSKIAPPYVAWATADLTPDNVYIRGCQAILADPKQAGRGVPLVDVAMFGTLSEEIYAVPGGECVRECSEMLAEDIAKLVDAPNMGAFELGRARQFALSSRFQFSRRPEKATEYGRQSLKLIRELVEEYGA